MTDPITHNEEENESDSKKIAVNSNEKIILQNPQFFRNVLKLINHTDAKTVANYMAWRVVKSSMKHLNKDAQNIKQQYDKAITGKAQKKATWKRCAKFAGFNQYSEDSESGFNEFKGAGAASSMYVRRYFVPEQKVVMLEMIKYIRQHFGKILEGVSWMDNNTKIEAKKKLDKMSEIVAYPDEIIDENVMTNLYKGINLFL